MSTHHADSAELARITEEFLDDLRSGQQPSIDAYAQRYSSLASEIREIFPALVALERIAPDEVELRLANRQTIAMELGDYRIVREIGRGGMGVVYEARQESLNRTVALKLLPPAATLDEMQLQRFGIESRAAAGLQHPRIVSVYDAGQHGETHYFAMQYVDGCSVADIVSHWRCSRAAKSDSGYQSRDSKPSATKSLNDAETPRHDASETVRSGDALKNRDETNDADDAHRPICAQIAPSVNDPQRDRWSAELISHIADGLDYAHEHGIIHRDVKPSNILLNRDGEPFIADFGLARIEADATVTRTGDLLGTLQYMSPEQLAGPTDRIDQRSDLYALAATLYEMLTLHRPFEHLDQRQQRQTVLRDDPLPPRRLKPSIDRDLERIVLHALERYPDQRYQSCRELASDLRAYLDGRPISARRRGPILQTSLWLSRHRARVIGALVVSVLLAIGSSIAAVMIETHRRRAVAGEAAARELATLESKARHEADLQRVRAESAEQLAKDRLWAALRAQAEMLLGRDQPGQRFETLQVVRQAIETRDGVNEIDSVDTVALRSDIIAALGRFDVRELWRNDHPQSSVTVETTTFAPDFAHYAIHDGPLIVIRKVSDHSEAARLPMQSYPVVSRFSPDSKWLAVVVEDPTGDRLEIWNWHQGDVHQSFNAEQLGAPVCRYSAAFDPAGSHVAIGLRNNRVVVLSLEQNRIVSQFDTQSPVHAIAYSPNGQYLAATVSDARHVAIWSVANQKLAATIEVDEPAYAVDWSRDGRQLAVATGYQARIFTSHGDDVVSSLTTRPPVRVRGHASPIHEIRFRPDGTAVATWGYDGKTRIWDAQRGSMLLAVDGHADSFDPTGTRLAFRSSQSYGVWELVGGDCLWEVASVEGSPLSTVQLAWLGDGSVLAADNRDEVIFWDVTSRRLLGRHPAEGLSDMVKHPNKDELLICQSDQLIVLRPELARTGSTWELHDVASERIPLPPEAKAVRLHACSSDDGGIIAIADDQRPGILLLDFDYQQRAELATSVNAEVLWLSPDARHLVTGLRHETPLYVYELPRLEQVATLIQNGTSMMGIDPHAGVLVGGSWRGYRAWQIGSWQRRYDIARQSSRQPCALAVDRAGRWAIAADAGASLIRFQIETGVVTGRFRSFHPDASVWNLCLNPDSSQLAVACLQHGLQVWDLGQINEELNTLNLSWDD